jgi:polyhydroxyalkanoate synthesis regulator phasin
MYAREYHLISKEKISKATGSKLLINIFKKLHIKYINLINEYMTKSKFVIDKLAKLFEQGLISYKDLSSEIINVLKSKRDEIVFKMQLTSKEETDILIKRVENLEKKIAKLEKNNLKKRTTRVKIS